MAGQNECCSVIIGVIEEWIRKAFVGRALQSRSRWFWSALKLQLPASYLYHLHHVLKPDDNKRRGHDSMPLLEYATLCGLAYQGVSWHQLRDSHRWRRLLHGPYGKDCSGDHKANGLRYSWDIGASNVLRMHSSFYGILPALGDRGCDVALGT